MLVSLQKKLDAVSCPSCEKKEVLQAVITCDHDEKTYEPVAHCKDCGLSLIVKLPENYKSEENHKQGSMVCNLETAACSLELEDHKKIA